MVSTMRSLRGAILALFATLVYAPLQATAAIGNTTCVSAADARNFMPFCRGVDWDVHGPSASSTHFTDNIAKQTFIQTLHSVTTCGGTVLSKSCSIAFQKYTCAYHFPKCNNVTGELIQPCREVCEHYCSICNTATCPCFDLPVKGGDTKCTPLSDICPYGEDGCPTEQSSSANRILFHLLSLAAAAVVSGALAL